MNTSVFIDLIQNVALLLALALLHDTITHHPLGARPSGQQLVVGIIVGSIGIAVMLTPWELSPGIIFDTRSILLSASGLFLGTLPTLVAVLMTMAIRFYQGGAGVWMGVTVIVASGSIGVAWRHWRRGELEDISSRELYRLGLLVHVVMLAAVLLLPGATIVETFLKISLPVMILYPLGTVLLGKLMARRLIHNRAEQMLKQSEEKFRKAFFTNPDSININRLEDGLYVSINKGFTQIMGYSEAEVIGKTSLELNIWADPEARRRLVEGLRAHGIVENLEAEFCGKNDVRRNGLMSASVLELDGKPHILSITRDITSRKQADLALRESHRQLEEMLATLQETQEKLVRQERLAVVGQLAGGIAHDFNNLLVPIIGYAELGMMKLLPYDDLYTNFTQIKKAADRAAGLTRQILAFSRKQLLQIEPVDLNIIIRDSEKMLQRLLREDIEIKTVLQPTLPAIKADKTQLEQVLMNLIVNARDAMPHGGQLVIETGHVFLNNQYAAKRTGVQPGPYVVLTISDTGHGMNEEIQKHIFEPFFTTKERGQGTGLGLATVFGIVKQHGGNIWVYSEPDCGTTCKIYLPQSDEPVEPIQPVQPESVSTFGSETILVVEDEAMVRQLVGETLEAHGYNVIEATCPQEALQQIAGTQRSIHLLLTDVIMPGMNGVDLYHQLTAGWPQIRVLYMSGYTDNVITHQGILDRGVNFLQKPFTMYELTRRIREILELKYTIQGS